jgi:hypothetical protein
LIAVEDDDAAASVDEVLGDDAADKAGAADEEEGHTQD